MFFLKKILAGFLSPLSICLSLFVLSIYFFKKKKERKAAKLALAGLLLLILFSWSPFGRTLLIPLESGHQSLLDKTYPCTVIVVLGHGHNSDEKLSANAQLSSSAHARLLEGLRLAKLFPDAKLIFSGYGGHDDVPHAEVMAKAANEQKINPKRILLAPLARDTIEEAEAIKLITSVDDSIVLVSEASHLSRAEMIFKANGLSVRTSPGMFYTAGVYEFFIKPKAYGLRMTERAFHEYMGLLWVKLKYSLFT